MGNDKLFHTRIGRLIRRFIGSSRACRLLLDCLLVLLLAGSGGLLCAAGRQLIGDECVLTALITLLLVGLFGILSPYMTILADRLIYRRRLHPQVVLAQMTEKLAGALHIEEIAALLTQELPQQMAVAHGILLIANEEHTLLHSVGPGDAGALPAADWDQFWLTLPNAPLSRSAAPATTPPPVLEWMRAQSIELLTPLQAGKRLIGLLGLAPRSGAWAYSTAEVRMIGMLARQATVAVQNALLVQHIETHEQQLQEEVAQHTRSMAADRNRLNAILQNLADALIVTDAAGRIQLVNPAAENLLRRAARALVGQDIRQVAPVPDWLDAITHAQEYPGIIEVARIRLADPRALLNNSMFGERILTVSATALGDRSAVICILRDITHEVEIDRMKSAFITTVSHELRTPLTSILGFAKLVQRMFARNILPSVGADVAAQQAVDRVTKNLEIMVQEGERLTDLLSDVLDISALDSGGIEWNDQPFFPAEVITQAVTQFQPLAAQKGLQLNLIFENVLPEMYADPKRIAQVLGNLLSNAVKFTARGSVTLTARAVEGEAIVCDWIAPPEGGLLVSVADTGIGIPHGTMRRIFQRFSQGGDLLIDKPEGAGLGLTLSREILLHYGGDIWVESTEGQGATFYFVLPRLSVPTES
ncbi:MAG TPA: ATP-binding protein [Anaerolineae bacterium]|nr:ATP-binding protein [Anaerolineae bacterium]